MSLTLEQKQAVVAEVAAVAAAAPALIAAEYSGLNVAEMTALRRSARDAGIYLRVVRNTLARRAFEGTQFDCMRSTLTGPLLLAFSNDEPGSAAKVIRDFAKENGKLVVRLISLDGRLLDSAEIESVANLAFPGPGAFHAAGLAAGSARQIPACPVGTGGETAAVA